MLIDPSQSLKVSFVFKSCLLSFLALIVSASAFATEVIPEAETRIRQVFNNDQRLVIAPYNTHTENSTRLLTVTLGAQTFFASADGRYIFGGAVIDTQSMQNITELKAQDYRAKRMASLDKSMYLSFPATDERQSVTLFTDIDCGYCRQFHTQIEAINAAGITVNYVMLPRSGLNSPSFLKAKSVLCSKNPQKNMTLAMRGRYFGGNSESALKAVVNSDKKTGRCSTTLAEQLQLAQELGIQHTPSMVLPNGRLKLGLVTPEQLNLLLAENNSL